MVCHGIQNGDRVLCYPKRHDFLAYFYDHCRGLAGESLPSNDADAKLLAAYLSSGGFMFNQPKHGSKECNAS
jgi:hypothetical protein